MELEELEYVKRPFNTSRAFEIHSLTNNGFSKYISSDSYTHKYLEQRAPKLNSETDNQFYSTSKNKFFSKRKSMFDEIIEGAESSLQAKNKNEENNEVQNENNDENNKEEEQTGNNKEIEKNDFNHDFDTNNNECKDSKDKKELNIFNTQAYFYKPNLKNDNNNNNVNANLIYENYDSKKIINNTNKKFKLSMINSYNTNTTFSPSYFTNTQSSFKTAYQKNLSISTDKAFQYKKSNLDPINRRLNITTSNFKQTLNTDSNKNSNSRFDKNYIKNLNLLINSKSYFTMDKIIETDATAKKGHDGFQSYNIPHVKRTLLSVNENPKNLKKPIALLAEKIAKSCVGNKKITYELSQSENKMKETQEESEKLKKIMMTQTNSDFLRRSKLPEIQSCVAQPKLKILKNAMAGGKIKHLGEKYNPYNFLAGRDCETNRRNQNGSLFQH